jgi:hypothetical protein
MYVHISRAKLVVLVHGNSSPQDAVDASKVYMYIYICMIVCDVVGNVASLLSSVCLFFVIVDVKYILLTCIYHPRLALFIYPNTLSWIYC